MDRAVRFAAAQRSGGFRAAARMLSLAILAAAVAGCAATSSPPGPPPTAHRLTEDEIRAALIGSGNTAEGADWQGRRFTLYIAPDGSARYRDAGLNDVGVWRIAGGEDGAKWCSKWTLRRKGGWVCDEVFRDGERFFFAADGRIAATLLRVAAGNTAGLDGAPAVRK
ncbi:MAG TPA: hypothetical protein VGD08_07170 [Stellaceae bacterium]